MSILRPKTDTGTANFLINQLYPYLIGSEQFTFFIQKRIEAQIDEIKDRHRHMAVRMYYLFSINEIDEGTRIAEDVVSSYPLDPITWSHYALCLGFRVGSAAALDATARGFDKTKDFNLLLQGCSYANYIGKYDFILSSADTLAKMEKLSDGLKLEPNFANMIVAATAAREVCNLEELSAVGCLMEKISELPGRQISVTFYPPFAVGDDSDSCLFEVAFHKIDAKKCAELNVRLIDERIKEGLTDWSVVGVFTTEQIRRESDNACFAE